MIRLTSGKVTCSCTVVGELSQDQIRPNESVSVTIKGQVPLFGEQTSTVTFQSDHPQVAIVTIPVRLVGSTRAIPYVYVRPTMVSLLAAADAPEARTSFRVSCLEKLDQPPWLQGFDADDASVSVEPAKLIDTTRTSEFDVMRHYELAVVCRESVPQSGDRIVTLNWRVA